MKKIKNIKCTRCSSIRSRFVLYNGFETITVDKTGTIYDHTGKKTKKKLTDSEAKKYEFIDGMCLSCDEYSSIKVSFDDGIYEKGKAAYLHYSEQVESTRKKVYLTDPRDWNAGEIYVTTNNNNGRGGRLSFILVDKKPNNQGVVGPTITIFDEEVYDEANTYITDLSKQTLRSFSDQYWVIAEPKLIKLFHALHDVRISDSTDNIGYRVSLEKTKEIVKSFGLNFKDLFKEVRVK